MLEFGLAGLSNIEGGRPILTQYGVEDTMKDLMFNTAGALTTAILGEAYLTTSVEQLKEKFESINKSEKY